MNKEINKNLKKCCDCSLWKEKELFHKKKSKKDGLNYRCKECDKKRRHSPEGKEKIKQSYLKYKADRIKRSKDYYENNKEKCKKRGQKYQQKNKQIILEQKRQWRQKNPELSTLKYKEEYKNRKEKDLKKKQWLLDNLVTVNYPNDYRVCSTCDTLKHESKFKYKKPSHKVCRECYNEYMRKYRFYPKRQKYFNSISYKIASICRTSMNNAIKKYSANKKEKTLNYLGCSIEFLIDYLKSQFTSGMTEELLIRGKEIHIDHKIPCCSRDLTNEENLKIIFHYTNLRPLWATKKIAMKYGENENYIGNLEKSSQDKKLSIHNKPIPIPENNPDPLLF